MGDGAEFGDVNAGAPDAAPNTKWEVVWAAFGGGVVGAVHIGKLPPALPMIQDELNAGFVVAGWIASMISATGFALGLVAGAMADRLGHRRVLLFGLTMLAVGSALGAFATTAELMLVTRFIEGIGFACATVAGGAVIAGATSDGDRRWALGIWAIYMPLGFAGMMMISAVFLDSLGWRAIWGIACGISVLWIAVVLWATAAWQRGQRPVPDPATMLDNLRRGATQLGAVLAGGVFAFYAAQHIAMMNWLPTYMQEVHGSGTLVAAAVPALVLVFNGAGNYVAAWTMGRGAAIWMLLAVGSAGMAVSEVAIFSGMLPVPAQLGFALLFGVAGGFIPAAALAAPPVYAPTPALVGSVGGIMVMGSNTGQLFGPPALAAVREAAGNWAGTVWLLAALAALAVVCALLSRPMERRAVRSG